MSEIDAMNILIGCKPLLKRLSSTGVNLDLNEVERSNLHNFGRIRQAGFTYKKLKELALRAGLAPSDLGLLNWFSLQHFDENTVNPAPQF